MRQTQFRPLVSILMGLCAGHRLVHCKQILLIDSFAFRAKLQQRAGLQLDGNHRNAAYLSLDTGLLAAACQTAHIREAGRMLERPAGPGVPSLFSRLATEPCCVWPVTIEPRPAPCSVRMPLTQRLWMVSDPRSLRNKSETLKIKLHERPRALMSGCCRAQI